MIEAPLLEFANKVARSKIAGHDLSDPIFTERLALAVCAVAVADEADRAATEDSELTQLEAEFS